MRWLYHVTTAATLAEHPAEREGVSPPTLAREGFIHASYRDAVRESARLYFPAGVELRVVRIDPRRVGAKIVEAATPRGPMPHVHGAIAADAVREALSLDALDDAPDEVKGTRIAFIGFANMTLLDLVGVLDPLSRIASMGFDPTLTCDVISADGATIWEAGGAKMTAQAVRPSLDVYDAIIVAGGLPSRTLCEREDVTTWLASFPPGRLAASVCTGALLLGAAGRLRGLRATTHASAMDRLASFGATAVSERVVDEGNVVTAGGVTAGIDLGLHLVRRLEGDETAARIAAQMEWRG